MKHTVVTLFIENYYSSFHWFLRCLPIFILHYVFKEIFKNYYIWKPNGYYGYFISAYIKISYIKLSKKCLFLCVLFFQKSLSSAVFSTLFAWVETAKGEGGRGESIGQRRDMCRNSVDTFQNNASTHLVFFLGLWFGQKIFYNFKSNFQ